MGNKGGRGGETANAKHFVTAWAKRSFASGRINQGVSCYIYTSMVSYYINYTSTTAHEVSLYPIFCCPYTSRK